MSIKGNTVGTPMPRSDWNETDPKKASYIKNKPKVLDGEDGGYYTPSVSNLDESTMTVSFTASKEGMPAVSDMQVQLPRGPKGDTGATGAVGPEGPQGPKGDKGETGSTGATGPQGPKGDTGATGPEGPKGDKGDPGEPGAAGQDGAAGYTPVKGTDYFTDADVDAIVAKAAEKFYDVGSLYISLNSTDPAIALGFGTWERIEDVFLLGASSTYAAGTTGGEAEHTLTIEEIPAHTHATGRTKSAGKGSDIYVPSTSGTESPVDTTSTGSNMAHNNMPPYLAVYMWKRTA